MLGDCQESVRNLENRTCGSMGCYDACDSCCTQDGCFEKGTLITMADGTMKPVELVKVGDIVLSYNEETQFYEAKLVERAYSWKDTPRLIELIFDNGTILHATPNHPIYTSEGWKSRDIYTSFKESKIETDWLRIGDTIITDNNNTKLVSIKELNIPEHYTTYNLAIKDCHTFIANGIVVHNDSQKKPPDPGLDTPTG